MPEAGSRPPRRQHGFEPSRHEQLCGAIAREEARLARLDTERAQAQARLAGLQSELTSLGDSLESRVLSAPQPAPGAPETPAEKVGLFRSLFRGRTDVFPTRFVSKRTGQAGYAPACRDKFSPGVCGLPKVKCGECPNQAFLPFDDAAVLAHLTGRQVLGLYPLLEDDTCWLLAADFDKHSWTDDVHAFAETCRRSGLPASIERSRSGNGAHAWFFFSAPVPASAARAMGCHLLTETLSRRHELGLDSYDRLFPSQDTLPRGGFGNLIALPLQREARRVGNTVFLDEQLTAIADDAQWAYLASIPRIAPDTVARIASEAARAGSVVGLRRVEVEDAEPWNRRESSPARKTRVMGPLPRRVRAVLAQRLVVEKASLPSPMLDQIQRLAAFQNPEFYKRQRMRLSTATTPRVIACAECVFRTKMNTRFARK
jgi:hypothetical protein